MAKRRGGKKKKQEVTLPHVTYVTKDNPLFSRSHAESTTNPRSIKVAYNTRESYAAHLLSNNKISDAQYMADSKMRELWEKMGGTIQAMDYASEPVDGGGFGTDISERASCAAKEWKLIHPILGTTGAWLALKISGEGYWPQDLSPDPEMRRYYRMHIKVCWDQAAKYLRLK